MTEPIPPTDRIDEWRKMLPDFDGYAYIQTERPGEVVLPVSPAHPERVKSRAFGFRASGASWFTIELTTTKHDWHYFFRIDGLNARVVGIGENNWTCGMFSLGRTGVQFRDIRSDNTDKDTGYHVAALGWFEVIRPIAVNGVFDSEWHATKFKLRCSKPVSSRDTYIELWTTHPHSVLTIPEGHTEIEGLISH